MKHQKAILVILGFAVLLAAFYYFVFYGFHFPPCVYREKNLVVPQALERALISMQKDQYVVVGKDPESCSPDLGDIRKEIVSESTINNISIGRQYFEDRDRVVEVLPGDTEFRLMEIVARTKHGITAIDSGRGPIYYLILQDSRGETYKIATVQLGFEEEDAYLIALDEGMAPLPLSWTYFEEAFGTYW